MTKPLISSDPAVMVGKPCIAGTRITVELIVRLFAEGIVDWHCAGHVNIDVGILRAQRVGEFARCCHHLGNFIQTFPW